jgi:hypothetical protein
MAQKLIAIGLVCLFVRMSFGDDAIPEKPELRQWKGNIHTHSLWSDGNDFPEMIAEWYRTRGYNFLALSDHNILSAGQKWMAFGEIVLRGGDDVLPKYQARFGGGWVETRGGSDGAELEIRLKPLDEFRAIVEQRGQFIMIQGEEISDRVEELPVHLNATNLERLIEPVGGTTVREAIENNLRAVQQHADRSGREILLHLNHPNFLWAVTAEDLAAAVSERFFEVYNGHPIVGHLGDDHHPGVERIWDVANTLRIAQLQAPPLYGVATDDSHTYHGRKNVRPGRGWIMVQSRYLTPEYLVRSIKRGDFYASSGVSLSSVTLEDRVFRVAIDGQPGVTYRTEFIGTLADYDQTLTPRTTENGDPLAGAWNYSREVGQVLHFSNGLTAEYRLTGKELYVRARVTSSRPHPDPSFRDQNEQAWTQPVGWETAAE